MKKLLVITSRVPFPLDKGDKLRMYYQVKELSKHYNVHLCCLDDSNTPFESRTELKKICNEVTVVKISRLRILFNLALAVFKNKPYQVYYFYQKRAHKTIKKIIAEFSPDYLYCQLIRTAEYIKHEHHIPKTIDYMDAFSKGIDRRIDNAGWLKPLFKDEAKRLVKYEHLTFDYFDKHTIISQQDRNFIFHQKRNEIEIIPNGIDTAFFYPFDKKEKNVELIFVGNMSYAPNIRAATYLAENIMPLLPQTIKLVIAGANPAKEVKKLESKNIKVTGWIDDIRTAYNSAKIFVAPLFIGTGLQNKLLEAMAMELPCITTTLANNSLGAIPEDEVLIAQTPEEFVKHIKELVNNPEKRMKIGKKARKFVKEKYSWEKSTQKLSEVIQESKRRI